MFFTSYIINNKANEENYVMINSTLKYRKMNESNGNFLSPSGQNFLTKKELKEQARNLEGRRDDRDGEVKTFAGWRDK